MRGLNARSCEEDLIKMPMMPDKVVERLEGNIWEYERELEGVFVGFSMDLCTC